MTTDFRTINAAYQRLLAAYYRRLRAAPAWRKQARRLERAAEREYMRTLRGER
jgi:hypothetical protein